MQVSVESLGELKRRITVLVPAEQVESTIAGKISESADGNKSRQELLDEVIDSSLRDALIQENLKPAGTPEIVATSMDPGEPLEFSATLEVYPEIKLRSLADITIEKPVAQVEDSDVDIMLNKLRAQQANWTETNRPADWNDQLIIDYRGTIDGSPFPGGDGASSKLVLGSGTMIDGFEKQLIGSKTGEQKQLELNFPGDYFNKDLAGKNVHFAITIHSIQEATLPDLDDDFAKNLGIDAGFSALREQIKLNMESELGHALRTHIKEKVLDALLEAHPIEAPQALVEEEISRLRKHTDAPGEIDSFGSELPTSIFEEQAKRQALVGLLLVEVLKNNSIQLDTDRVSRRLEAIASTYEEPAQIIATYRNDPSMMKNLEGLVIEEQAVESLLAQMNVKEVPSIFSDIVTGGAT